MRFLRQSLTGLLLLSLTVGILAYAGLVLYGAVQARLADEAVPAERRERMFAVRVITAEEAEIAPVLTAFGEVQSRRVLELRSKAAGRLVTLDPVFEEGGRVTAGQLLAQIDPADAAAAEARARSDVMDAEAEERDAARGLGLARDELGAARAQADLRQRAFARQVDLEARGVGTAAAVEVAELAAAQADQAVLTRRIAEAAAEAREDQAVRRLARAQIALEEAQRRLAETEIRAGFSGALSDVAVVEGRLVTANERLATLIDPERLEVAFRISTPQFARLLDDDARVREAPVTVTLEAFGAEIEATGRILRASAAVGEAQVGRLVFAALDAAEGLRPGDFVTVRIEEPALPRLVRLPSAALGADGTVLALGQGDQADRLEALSATLIRRQGDDILVRGEALQGREIVTERSPLLGAGIKVRAIRGTGQDNTQDQAAAPEMLELDAERRARLVAYVEGNARMPEAVKARLLGQLNQTQVEADVVQRLENRMGG
ncbi:HlyD family efflux transporter periplasmic adaptor subunit [Roseovarius sp. LXJ103]|uniref:efflux RND transporter periplasmic adaptor subunit n=1 Tax=Roseovarius carneus TaxID=2853164 RepID=UPI000D61B94D|nr:HlyD family efflux transporter periplasmic adaptor subunit [Roseovarius carneus]MBZ8118176.1 HlyD family efflux transporter periplasmic adaptor subunit [Roseovarius carneus]PWE36093.1 efflux transporter periplasmic adaptor subunit [Pelagicola sp. LXJ1103]